MKKLVAIVAAGLILAGCAAPKEEVNQGVAPLPTKTQTAPEVSREDEILMSELGADCINGDRAACNRLYDFAGAVAPDGLYMEIAETCGYTYTEWVAITEYHLLPCKVS